MCSQDMAINSDLKPTKIIPKVGHVVPRAPLFWTSHPQMRDPQACFWLFNQLCGLNYRGFLEFLFGVDS